MENFKNKICDQCQKREATNFLCDPNTATSINLCDNCVELRGESFELDFRKNLMLDIEHGKCQFCGNPATGGTLRLATLLEPSHMLWCDDCRLDLMEFLNQHENRLDNFGHTDYADPIAMKQLSYRLKDWRKRLEEYMQLRVIQRGR